jgi:1,4-dihydroxy-2-naphthoyl-CoA hydrolase
MFRKTSVEEINAFSKNTLIDHLSIKFKEVGDDFISATMPVNSTTHQPVGFLHGGATMALAETVGSLASYLIINPKSEHVFGLEINGNHIKSKKSGIVTATARAIHLGSKTHIWDIQIKDEESALISIVRLTNMVVDARK